MRRSLTLIPPLAVSACLALAACAPAAPFTAYGYRSLPSDAIWRIEAGQTQQQVLELFGAPFQTMAFPRTNTTAWDYRYTDTWGYPCILSITFDAQERVLSRISQRIERDRGL
jgi:outer membrane protein assembly factor BamE (lipoprotein component of BamABCDE complex)